MPRLKAVIDPPLQESIIREIKKEYGAYGYFQNDSGVSHHAGKGLLQGVRYRRMACRTAERAGRVADARGVKTISN